MSETDCFKPLVARARVTMDNSNVGIRFMGTIWSRAIISLLFGCRNRLAGAYLVSAPAEVWSRGLFGFVFIAPRLGTLQLLQLYETDANDVAMAVLDNFHASSRRFAKPKSRSDLRLYLA